MVEIERGVRMTGGADVSGWVMRDAGGDVELGAQREG